MAGGNNRQPANKVVALIGQTFGFMRQASGRCLWSERNTAKRIRAVPARAVIRHN